MVQTVVNKLVPFHVAMLLTDSEKRLPDGFRLSVVRWKTPSEKKNDPSYKVRPAVCVAIPALKIEVKPESVATAMQEAFEELQDNVIAATINARIAADTGINLATIEIESNSVTYDGIAAWAAQKAISGRLSKDAIGTWFDMVLKSELELKLAEIPEITEERLNKAVLQHRKMLQDLASPKASMPVKLAEQLQRALNLVSGTDKVKETLNNKLETFLKPTEYEELLGI